MNTFRTALWVAMLLAVPSAHAVRAIDAPPPTRAAVLNASRPDPALQADDSASLRRGSVAAVSPNADAVLVNGSWLAIVEGRTTLFRQGRPVPASQLGKGQMLRFTLAPGSADRKVLGVVYVP